MNAIKNGSYKKLWEKRKKDPVFMERKRMLDLIYKQRIKDGTNKGRITNDTATVNVDWSSYRKNWQKSSGFNAYKALKTSNKYHENRIKIIEHYTNGEMACKHCGCKDLRVLDIDHINDNGATHRKEIGQLNIVWWVVEQNYPDGFQILCKNCNWIKELERRNIQFSKVNQIS